MDFKKKVFYMFNGLIVIAKLISTNDGRPIIREALALIPQDGTTDLMEAFPFTDFDEPITLEASSFITMTDLTEEKVIEEYEKGNKQVRSQRSGLVLP